MHTVCRPLPPRSILEERPRPLKLVRPVWRVLIDADNASAKIADGLFEEIAKIGEANRSRA